MKNPWVKARVMDASDRSYSAALLPLFATAKKEIFISLYLMEPADTAPPSHPVNALLEALLCARTRGVRVRMLLNTNFRFKPKTEVGTGNYFTRLLESGVELISLLPGRRLHDKLIVIDRRYVVDGSMNWSISALMSNYESVTVIDSPAHAEKKRARMEKIVHPPAPGKRGFQPHGERSIDSVFLQPPPEVEIPLVFFEKNYFPAMISAAGERAFDLTMILLGQTAAAAQSAGGSAAEKKEVLLDLETTGRALKFPAGWTRSAVRRQMIKVLRALQDRYQVIEAEFPYAGNARVRLKDFAGEKIPVPGGMFDPNFLAAQYSAAVFLGLCGEVLKKEGVDINKLTALELEKRFFVDHDTFSRARKS